MISKFAGQCCKCGRPIAKGEEINYERGVGASHIKCVEQGSLLGESEAVELAERLGFRKHEEVIGNAIEI